MAQYEADPSVVAYGNAAMAYPMTAPRSVGTSIIGPPTVVRKPRLMALGNGAFRVIGADDNSVLFPPQQPLAPIAQPPQAGVVGRAWDYPPAYNLRVTPRDGQEFGFQTLRALADGYDVLSGLIERVKDKIIAEPWSILPRKEKGQPAKKKDGRCQKIEEFLQYPDKAHTWVDWSRELLDQVIVYDAPSIYLRPDRKGDLYALEIIDGSQITPKIMPDGRSPPPEMGPAYSHVIKRGLPAVLYINPVPRGTKVPLDPDGWPMPELLYKPRNPRVHSPYGRSVVEQMITTVNIAIRREAFLLSFYTNGSAPDTVFTCPPQWTTQDIANFKLWWDSVLEGNLGNRRGTMFVPDGAKPIDMKEGALSDETDQWLIRIMCFFLGLNPMPFIKMMNRATGQAHQQQGEQEGLAPWQKWFSDLFNHIIRIKWGFNDIEFRWEENESTQPQEQATIDVALVNAKIYHPDEIRAKRGDDPMEDDMRAEMDMPNYNGSANSTVLPPDQQDEADQRAKEKAEHVASLAPKPEPLGAVQAQAAKAAEDLIKVAAAMRPEPSSIHVDAPKIEFPKFEFPPITMPPITVNMPEMKAADVFVDVGATNVRVEAPKSGIGKTVTAQRMKDGKFVGTISDGVTRAVTATKDKDGNMVAKVDV